jgi:hypothetical protein
VVNTRYMFWVERFMCVLKWFVHQRIITKGSIAEGCGWMDGYIVSACTTSLSICQEHMKNHLLVGCMMSELQWQRNFFVEREPRFDFHMKSKKMWPHLLSRIHDAWPCFWMSLRLIL